MRPAVEHILRELLPWQRGEAGTECGRPVAEFAAVLTRDQAIAKFRALGQTRATMTTCVTCAQTVDRHATWATNPAAALARVADRYVSRYCPDKKAQRRFNDELRALALLAEAHREEFEELLAGLTGAVDLRQAQAARDLKQARAAARGRR